jgi:hypothetical protein
MRRYGTEPEVMRGLGSHTGDGGLKHSMRSGGSSPGGRLHEAHPLAGPGIRDLAAHDRPAFRTPWPALSPTNASTISGSWPSVYMTCAV